MIDFEKLRHDPDFHLGLGDVRLTIGMQEEIEARIKELEAELFAWGKCAYNCPASSRPFACQGAAQKYIAYKPPEE